MISEVLKLAAKFRNQAYDNRWFKIHRIDCPVVAVGNLTMGGTGKTPFISELLKWTENSNIKAGVVSRGYRGNFKGVKKVVENSKEEYFGDEPIMLATKHPQAPVYVCPDRVLAAQILLKDEKVDLILADDAFQHRRLKRDLDLVVVDLLENERNYQMAPKGRAREPLESLKRCHFVLLNKRNIAKKGSIDRWKHRLKGLGIDNSKILYGDYELQGLESLSSEDTSEKTENKVYLLSAIGNPESFESLVEGAGYEIMGHGKYRDHYDYQRSDLERALTQMKSSGASRIVCTDKDKVKLKPLMVGDEPLYSAPINLVLSGAKEELYESIRALVL